MAEKLTIEIFRKKQPEELTKNLADPESRVDVGSGAALSASVAAAFLTRAAAVTAAADSGNERADYILRNGETLRAYMIHLIDEDVKSRGPLRKAMKEEKPLEIEAARQPATAVAGEIVTMMTKCLELLDELAGFCPADARYLAAASADLAIGAMKASMRYIVDMGSKCSDETYRYITRRENEITLEQYLPVYEGILEKLK